MYYESSLARNVWLILMIWWYLKNIWIIFKMGSNSKKFYFLQIEEKYLCHSISLYENHRILTELEQFNTGPYTIPQLKLGSFFRLCLYYRPFIKEFADITRTLNCLPETDRRFTWLSRCFWNSHVNIILSTNFDFAGTICCWFGCQ